MILAFFCTQNTYAETSCNQIFSSAKKSDENLLRPETILETDREPIDILQMDGVRILLEWNPKSLSLHLRPIQDIEKSFSGSKMKLLNILKQHQAFQLPPDALADLKKINASNFKNTVNDIEWKQLGPTKILMVLDTDYFSYSFELDFRNFLLRKDENIVAHIDSLKNSYSDAETAELLNSDGNESESQEPNPTVSYARLPFKNAVFKIYDFPQKNRRVMIGTDQTGVEAYLAVLPLDVATKTELYLFPSNFVHLKGVHPGNSDLIGMYFYEDQLILAFQTETHLELISSDFKSKIPSAQHYHVSYTDKKRQVLFHNKTYDKDEPPGILLGQGGTAVSVLTQDPFKSWGSIIYDMEQKKYFHSAWSIRQNRDELPLEMKVFPVKEMGPDHFAVFLSSFLPKEERYIRRWIIMKP